MCLINTFFKINIFLKKNPYNIIMGDEIEIELPDVSDIDPLYGLRIFIKLILIVIVLALAAIIYLSDTIDDPGNFKEYVRGAINNRNDLINYIKNSPGLKDNNPELNCGDPNQDGSNRIYQCPPDKTLKLPPNDNLCVGDTCTDDDCCVDIQTTSSSSFRTCQPPPPSVLNKYNMTGVVATDLSMDSFDVTGISCKEGYSGVAVATVCSRPHGHYNVSGCV
jgi:hypothetical protein